VGSSALASSRAVTWRELAAVIAGGMLGTAARFALDSLLPHGPRDFPIATLLVNVAGALALGFLVARVWSKSPSWLRAGLGAGLLGSFTTFSALAVSLVSLGFGWTALLYLALSVVLGLGAALAGLQLGGSGRPLRSSKGPIDLVNE
jgi:CrcB protein